MMWDESRSHQPGDIVSHSPLYDNHQSLLWYHHWVGLYNGPIHVWLWMALDVQECHPLCGVQPIVTVYASDEENRIFRCDTAVSCPPGCCVLQMMPRPVLVNLTDPVIAGNQAAGDEVHRWAVEHLPWIVVKDAAPTLWISCWPKLNGLRCTSNTVASYDQDPCNV